MEGSSRPPAKSIPSIHLQPPSVDFIDQRLPDYHMAFQNPQARYEPALRRYVPTPADGALQRLPASSRLDDGSESESDDGNEGTQFPSPRKLLPEAGAMRFWDLIFDDSMQSFRSQHQEPKGRSESNYDIRKAQSWEAVYSKLQLARESFDGTKKGFWGRVKRVTRKAADHAGYVSRLAKFIPDGDYTTPVRAAVEVLLDAVQAASKVRKKVTKSIDSESLDRTFGDIEVFLATFPEDDNIKAASIELVVAAFKAIEDAIGFFIKHSVIRGVLAAVQGENYQESLLESISQVATSGETLVHQAQNSHIAATRDAMGAILQKAGRIGKTQKQIKESVDLLLNEMSQRKDNDARLMNLVLELLDSYQRNHETDREEFVKLKGEIGQLKHYAEEQNQLANQLTRAPAYPQQMWWLPPTISAIQAPPPMGLLPASTYHPQLAPWLGPFPDSRALAYPVAAPFPHLPFSPPAVQPWAEAPTINCHELQQLLGQVDVDEADINEVMENRNLIPARYRSRAEQVANTEAFRKWVTEPASRQLLVQGERTSDRWSYASALSLLCATMTCALRKREGYVSLVFFCGRHIEEDDEHAGGGALIRSLTAQLLRYYPVETTLLRPEIDFERAKAGDVGHLCALFSWLVRGLPRNLTLICLIDGIGHYETDDHEVEMLSVLKCLLDLVGDNFLPPTVKVLATSSSVTDRVRQAFGEESSCFLNMAGLPRVNQESSMLRWGSDDESEDVD